MRRIFEKLVYLKIEFIIYQFFNLFSFFFANTVTRDLTLKVILVLFTRLKKKNLLNLLLS